MLEHLDVLHGQDRGRRRGTEWRGAVQTDAVNAVSKVSQLNMFVMGNSSVRT